MPRAGKTQITAVAPMSDTNSIATTIVYTKTVNPITTTTSHFVLDVSRGYLVPTLENRGISLPGEHGVTVVTQNISFSATLKTITLHDLGRTVDLSSINATLRDNRILYFNQGATLFYIVEDTSSEQWLVSTPNTTSSSTVNTFKAGRFLGIDLETSRQTVRVFPDIGIVRLPAMCCVCVEWFFFDFNSTSIIRRNSFDYYDSRNSTLVERATHAISIEPVSNSSATVTHTFTEAHLRSFFVPWTGYSATELQPFQSPCTEDSQCVTATNGCCDCGNGGTEIAVLSSKKSEFVSDQQGKCGMTMCTLMARQPPCFHPSTGSVKCVANKCTWMSTSSSATTHAASWWSLAVLLLPALLL